MKRIKAFLQRRRIRKIERWNKEAMDYAAQSIVAGKSGHEVSASICRKFALALVTKAATHCPKSYEPKRSIYFRAAVLIALTDRQPQKAIDLCQNALEGDSPIRNQFYDMILKANQMIQGSKAKGVG